MDGSTDTQRDPLNVFVKYLPPEIGDDELRKMFSPFGTIASSKVMVNHNTQKSLGFGFVRFTLEEEAERAIQHMNEQIVGNKKLLCKLSNAVSSREASSKNTNLYIKPLDEKVTEDDLRGFFSKFGEIEEVKILVDLVTNKSRQIGFVRFVDQESADNAKNECHGQKFSENSPPLVVKYAETEAAKGLRKARKASNNYDSPVMMGMGGQMPFQPWGYRQMPQQQFQPPSNQYYNYPNYSEYALNPGNGPGFDQERNKPSTNLFIFHIPPTFTQQQLGDLFRPYGNVVYVKIAVDPETGSNRGFGFVTFSNIQEAIRAKTMLDGFKVEDKFLKVSFKHNQNSNNNNNNNRRRPNMALGQAAPSVGYGQYMMQPSQPPVMDMSLYNMAMNPRPNNSYSYQADPQAAHSQFMAQPLAAQQYSPEHNF